MSDLSPLPYATSPFTANLRPSVRLQDRGLLVSDRNGLGLGLASVQATRTEIFALAKRLQEALGIELPSGPQRATARQIAFAATGPGAWLVTHEAGHKALAMALRPVILGLGSLTDQTGGYAVLRLSGSRVRDVLCKLVPLDLHPRAFKVNDVASTIAGHVATTLWRLEDSTDGTAVFEIAVYRSFAEYFWRLLWAC